MPHVPPAVYDGEAQILCDEAGVRVIRADPHILVVEGFLHDLGTYGSLTLNLAGGVIYRLHSHDADLHTFKADRIDA